MIIKYSLLLSLSFLISTSIYSQSNSTDQPTQIYEVTVDHINKKIDVQLCFDQAPRYLYSTTKTANEITSTINWQGLTARRFMQQQNGYIDLPNDQKGCLSYVIDAKRSKGRLNSSSFMSQHPSDTVISIGSWLWKRSDHQKTSQAIIKFKHSKGVNISAPWSLLNRSDRQTEYLMHYTPDDWAGYMAFGPFDTHNLMVGDNRLRLAFIHGKNKYNKVDFIDWLQQMTDSVAAVSGNFPTKDTQVMIIMQKGSRGAVPWGQVNRGGGNGVLFIANPTSGQSTRIADWTAAHEFSHLLLPYTPYDRWLSEGFASYHQNISRARTGLLSERKTWEKLLAGFKRGQKAANKRNAPVLKSANRRSLMQMYWGGAVVALHADVALQKQSNGQMTLSKALAGLSECCLATGRDWNSKQTFIQLDKISKTTVFMDIYDNIASRKKYPDYQRLLSKLGVSQNRNGHIVLDNNAELAWIRSAIINGSK